MPWVIKDYTSPTLDLTDPNTFRDLSKPMGAQNPQRLATFKDRYNQMPADEPRSLHKICTTVRMAVMLR